MFGWLFKKKKKVNVSNRRKATLLREEIKRMSQKDRVRSLRRLKGIHTYDSDFDYMYGYDLLDNFIMFYLLMEMTDVVSEEDSGFYEVDETIIEEDIVEETETGEIVEDTEQGEEPVTRELEDIEPVVETMSDVEPTPIAVEEVHVEPTPVVEETVEVTETES